MRNTWIALGLTGVLVAVIWHFQPVSLLVADHPSTSANIPGQGLATSSPATNTASTAPAIASAIIPQHALLTNSASAATPTQASTRWNLTEPGVRAAIAAKFKKEAETAKAEAWGQARASGFAPIGTNADGSVYELMAIRDGRPVVYITLNKNAAISAAADLVRDTPTATRGRLVLGGVWDQGSVLVNHQEFATNRVTNGDGAASAAHSTHVGGTMAASGIDASAMGMAPEGRLLSYDWNTDFAEMILNAAAAPGETNLLQISNHSYGVISGWYGTWWYGTWGLGYRESDYFGRYDVEAQSLDLLCYSAPYYLPFQASGNDRNDTAPGSGQPFRYLLDGVWYTKTYNPSTDPLADFWDQGGYDTLITPASAKNIMVVGNVNDAVNGTARNLNNATISTSSSWGPTDDGRIKPDIVANGEGLFSSANGSTTAYASMGGTSMACASASGVAMLIIDYFRVLFPGFMPRSATLKGLLIHTADDLGRAGPDYIFGWGLLNAQRAADMVRRHLELPDENNIVESHIDTLNTSRNFAFAWDHVSPIRVTLSWTDPPGMATNSLDSTLPVLVNDLDLRMIAPNGVTNFPFVLDPAHPTNTATRGDNKLDNIEQVYLQSPAVTGVYTVVITSKSTPVDGVQPFSLIISGAESMPVISHIPLPNSYVTNQPYLVEATVTPEYSTDTTSVKVVWFIDDESTVTNVTPISPASNNIYRAELPYQPLGTRIRYYLSAKSPQGFEVRHPSDAPASLHSFTITPGLTIAIYGEPAPLGNVTPPYGENISATGNTFTISAELDTAPVDHVRYHCIGWYFIDDPSMDGSSNSFSFIVETNEIIMWNWAQQFELEHVSDPSGIISTSTWWFSGTTAAATVFAPTLVLHTDTNFCFTGWYLDGLRQTNAAGVAVNPITGIAMSTSRTATAVFLPESEDADDDGLVDWWEIFYFGSLAPEPTDDPDGDWFSNVEEFNDGADPTNDGSQPDAPVIEHTPLANPYPRPAPWPVTAIITDTVTVVEGNLHWRRQGQTLWHTVPMAISVANTYTSAIPAPGGNGDIFEYKLSATDFNGYTRETGIHSFSVAYPLWNWPAVMEHGTTTVIHGTTSNITVGLVNTGITWLTWTASPLALDIDEDVEHGTNGFTHGGNNDRWHCSTNRSASGSHAWYTGGSSGWQYMNAMVVQLVAPSLQIGADATLSFNHWIKCEYDSGVYYWDGGRVEISTNGGTIFDPITPVGGYPHRITPNPASPFPAGTGCYGDTGGWQPARLNLAPYSNTTAIIRFRFGSDAAITDEGWYIDDIRVTTPGVDGFWLNLAPATGTLAAASSTNLVITMHPATTTPGADYRAMLTVTTDDPFVPTSRVVCAIRDRTLPVISGLLAAQTSTNGSGLVTISNLVSSLDGSTCAIQAAFSTDHGVTWSNAWLAGAMAAWGSPFISNSESRQVRGIATLSNNTNVTNTLSIVWNTRQTPDINDWTTNALVRLVAVTPWVDGEPATSAVFTIDNLAPSATGAFINIHNLIPINIHQGIPVPVSWGGFLDEISSIRGYQCMTNGAPDGDWMAETNTMLSDVAGDATNIIYVRACDAFGNISTNVPLAVLVLTENGDYDRDGSPNFVELTAGTDPADRSIDFAITVTTSLTENAGMRLLWHSATGRHYTVEARNAFDGVNNLWEAIPDASNMPGTGIVMEWQDSNATPQTRYYKLRVSQP